MSESFDKVFAEIRQEYASVYSIGTLARLQKAHDHDMELARKAEYHRGYVAGQKSMDAEHQSIASKVMQVPYDYDAMEFLFHISAIICGGYYTSNKLLRDELVRLLGGVHDESVPMDASCGAGCADCDCGAGESRRVTYDELGNERHEAVCELRSISDSYTTTGDAAQFVCDMANAINAEGCDSETIYKGLRDRLIHLLGGNTEPLPNFSELFRTFAEPNLPKSAETAKPESEDGGENCRITDELRKFTLNPAMTQRVAPDEQRTARKELQAIADRIDEQFDRICWQQEAVLQQTIEGLFDNDELYAVAASFAGCDECGEYKQSMYREFEKRVAVEKERDELQKRLDRSRAEYCETCEEAETTDILRAKLDAIREALDGQQRRVD